MTSGELPSLENLRRYLLARGWHRQEHPNQRILILQTLPDPDGDYASVVLPTSDDLSDASQLIADAVRIAAAFERSNEATLADRAQHWDRDILRARFLKVLGKENSLPLSIAADVILALRQFIGYAAYTQTNPQPFFDKVGAISGEFAAHCRFGHTFSGSFGLTVECPVTVLPELPIEGTEPPKPIERQVFERVANGLSLLREAVIRDTVDPLISGYQAGFNANMCRTLAELYEKADGRRIEYDLSWSPQLRSRFETSWKPLLFDGKSYDFTRVAAAELERAEKFPDSIVEGRIVVLKSEMPPGLDEQAEFEHVITMFWEREKGQTVKIRVPLSPSEYIAACDAHKDGKAIRVRGIPEKAGKFWTLTKPHSFAVT